MIFTRPFQLAAVFATALFLGVQAINPDDVTVLGVPAGPFPCNGNTYTQAQMIVSIQNAAVKWPDNRVGPNKAKNPYPHPYSQPGVIPSNADCETARPKGQMYEFPIKASGLYENGPVSGVIEERIMFLWDGSSTATWCALASHAGLAGSALAKCPDTP